MDDFASDADGVLTAIMPAPVDFYPVPQVWRGGATLGLVYRLTRPVHQFRIVIQRKQYCHDSRNHHNLTGFGC